MNESHLTYFANITNSLEIGPIFKVVPDQLPTEQMVMRALDKYKDHKSICIIKEHLTSDDNNFQFSHANPMEVTRQIELLDKSKSNSGSIPTSQLKDTQDIVSPYLTDCNNTTIFNCTFPEELKTADVSPIFKELGPTLNSTFRPISVIPSTSKIHERILKDKMSHYFKDKLRDILCRFREGYSTQHALIRVMEKWRKCLDNSGIVGSILVDLSKAYDCLPHNLLIAKLVAYEFSINSLCLMYDYPHNRYQRVTIGSIRSSPQKIHVGFCKGQY